MCPRRAWCRQKKQATFDNSSWLDEDIVPEITHMAVIGYKFCPSDEYHYIRLQDLNTAVLNVIVYHVTDLL